jgi:hypothetical protein
MYKALKHFAVRVRDGTKNAPGNKNDVIIEQVFLLPYIPIQAPLSVPM